MNNTRKRKTFRNITVSNTRNIPSLGKKLKRIINILIDYLQIYEDIDSSSPLSPTYLILFNIFGENMSAHFREVIDTPRKEGDRFKRELDSYILRKYLNVFDEEESENPEEYVEKVISFIKWMLILTQDRIHRKNKGDEIKEYMKEFIGVCNTIFREWNKNLEFVREEKEKDLELDELSELMSRL